MEPVKAAVGDVAILHGEECRVVESCGGKPGWWLCLTHPRARLANQLQKDSHISERGKHILAWVCPDHGPEVP